MRRLTWPARGYVIALTVAAGAVLLADTPRLADAWRASWPTVLVLVVVFQLCEAGSTRLGVRQAAVSLGFAVILAAVVLTGPAASALVAMTAAIRVRPASPVVKRLFNGAQFAVCGYAAGWTFRLLGGRPDLIETGRFTDLTVAYTGAAVVFELLNFGLLVTMLALAREPVRGLIRILPPFALSYLGYASFGLLMAVLWVQNSPAVAMLVLVPLFVARWALDQYDATQRSWDATIAALARAVEAKDAYTRGHCVRVARGAVMIGAEIGMRPRRLAALHYAGMVHDVGKLAVPLGILQKDGRLTEEEFAAIQLHPMRGLEIVRDIEFLDEAYDGILHHHERIDGKGYPLGLAGDEIPEFARILGVADAFDAMTSSRSYRPARPIGEAVAELRRGAGTQFQPDLVDAFVRALARNDGRIPSPQSSTDPATGPATEPATGPSPAASVDPTLTLE